MKKPFAPNLIAAALLAVGAAFSMPPLWAAGPVTRRSWIDAPSFPPSRE